MKYKQILLTLGLFFFSFTGYSTELRIVTSILPLANLVSGISGDYAKVDSLLPVGASPHHYSLKPSDLKKLVNADIIFWMGSDLEHFLTPVMSKLSEKTRVIDLSKSHLQYLKRRPLDWQQIQKSEEVSEQVDPHIWLSTSNASILLAKISQVLQRHDKLNQKHYHAAELTAVAQLQVLKQDISKQLTHVNAKPYIVFHDALQYFENEFGLNAAGIMTFSPEQPLSAKQLAHILATVKAKKVQCFFHEPQFQPKIIELITEREHLHSFEMDPLGNNLSPNFQAYLDLMQHLSQAFSDCFKLPSPA